MVDSRGALKPQVKELGVDPTAGKKFRFKMVALDSKVRRKTSIQPYVDRK